MSVQEKRMERLREACAKLQKISRFKLKPHMTGQKRTRRKQRALVISFAMEAVKEE